MADRSLAGARSNIQLATTDDAGTDKPLATTATTVMVAPVEDERPLVVEPTQGLRDGQQLHVVIRRPPTQRSPQPSCVPVPGIIPANGGSFSADVAVNRTLVGLERDYDCASEACELRLLDSLPDGPVLARFDLTFSTAEPFERSWVRLESGTVHDGDSVTVRGSGLVARGFVSVQVCGTLGAAAAGAPSKICEKRMYNATIDDKGSFSVAVALPTRTTGFRLATGDVEFVCVGQPCTVVVSLNDVRGYAFRFQFGSDGIAELEANSQ